MNLLGFLRDLLRRPPPVATPQALAEFIDGNAAFLVQKGLYEYSRARAGHYAKVLFAEQGFKDAVEVSRWRAYPLGLAMVTELAEGLLRPAAADRQAQFDALRALALSVFDGYPVPAALGASDWGALRLDLENNLQRINMHAPKRAKDIPEPYIEKYFDLMPIHEKLRTAEFPTIGNYLRVTAINIHADLEKRADVPALAAMLSGRSA
ncbi:MAG: hypothetical protein K2Z80_02335 [Xanthobacteraceae bacterium]|nr:hypothetical protein [Xanthobacteraceae bacterium]